ncbi:hypothetical protein SAMN06265360_1504 [Haloechinothrix alba]|uniref:Uncharacterized protein n=1 Tax=Haloechinothrix alba TaxID=664784 RepID=A0A239AQ97_9PSEU|nr:hypothetical protein [Haloechinothrix alba]SNR97224.1 hypothetical protein SAMN06265360_1504 [Haloechinothrix alba]
MGMDRFHRFDVAFGEAFPKGLVLVGEIEPDNEFQQNRNAAPRQRVDERTGLRQWKGVFSDPAHVKESEASVKVTFLAEVQPVPSAEEFVPGCGMRPVELEGLQVTPKVTGQGEFKKLGWSYFATGFAEPAGSTGGGAGSASAAAAGSPASGGKTGTRTSRGSGSESDTSASAEAA